MIDYSKTIYCSFGTPIEHVLELKTSKSTLRHVLLALDEDGNEKVVFADDNGRIGVGGQVTNTPPTRTVYIGVNPKYGTYISRTFDTEEECRENLNLCEPGRGYLVHRAELTALDTPKTPTTKKGFVAITKSGATSTVKESIKAAKQWGIGCCPLTIIGVEYEV